MFFLTKSLVTILWTVPMFLTTSSWTTFATTAFFTTLLSLLKLTGIVTNLWTSDFKLPEPVSLANSAFVA